MSEETKIPEQVVLYPQHIITAFASTNPERAILNSVHFNREKMRVEATDGKFLIQVPVRKDSEFPGGKGQLPDDCVIPADSLNKAAKNLPKEKAKRKTPPQCEGVLLETSPDKTVEGGLQATLTTTDLQQFNAVNALCLEGEYPTFEFVWPTEAPKLVVALNANLLRTIAEYAKKHANETRDPCVRFEFIDELSPVRFSIHLKDGTQAKGLLMPMRLS